MKRTALVLVLLALLMAASGCEKFIKNDYLSVESHVESAPSETQPPEEETPPVVTNRNELRGTVLSFVRDWTELGTIYVRNYSGDLYTDLDETMRYLSDEDPIGAYAVDYADAELSGSPTYGAAGFSPFGLGDRRHRHGQRPFRRNGENPQFPAQF